MTLDTVILSVIYADCHSYWLSFMLSVVFFIVMLSVIMLNVVYTECRGALKSWLVVLQIPFKNT
jgi:hypothetical protein